MDVIKYIQKCHYIVNKPFFLENYALIIMKRLVNTLIVFQYFVSYKIVSQIILIFI